MLEINDFHVKFNSCESETLSGISLQINHGEIVGLVGESGSGKTTLVMGILGLLPYKKCICSGKILFNDCQMTNSKSNRHIKKILGRKICAVFQQTFSIMDPLLPVGVQIGEALRVHSLLNATQIKKCVLEVIEKVGLPKTVYNKYPHELSGGMVQRAMIASAIITKPELLLLDEPTTALDVATAEKIIRLLKDLNDEVGTAVLLVSHNLNIIRKACERIVVMQRGKLIKEGNTDDIFFDGYPVNNLCRVE